MKPLKENEVLVKIHAVSLQYRDLIITKGLYPLKTKPGVVPCSDAAGEIIQVGAAVADSDTPFKVGDRVCANFSPDQIYGDVQSEKQGEGGLGNLADGVLTKFRTFPAHVSILLLFLYASSDSTL